MATPYNERDVRDLKEWAKSFPNATGAHDTATWVATYDLLRTALADCATNETNPDTCGVCGLHFAECEDEHRAVGDEHDSHDVPTGREPACPGARARVVLRG
jgi:hypothetical protein